MMRSGHSAECRQPWSVSLSCLCLPTSRKNVNSKGSGLAVTSPAMRVETLAARCCAQAEMGADGTLCVLHVSLVLLPGPPPARLPPPLSRDPAPGRASTHPPLVSSPRPNPPPPFFSRPPCLLHRSLLSQVVCPAGFSLLPSLLMLHCSSPPSPPPPPALSRGEPLHYHPPTSLIIRV